MKRLFAFLFAFAFVALAGATLNFAQAGSSTAPDTTTTPSVTFAPTATPTEDLCPPPPPAPELLGPEHQAVFKDKTRIKLRWSEVECANKYRILVRRGSRDGEPVARGHTGKTKTFVELEPGHTYFWNIKACINNQCERSNTKKFTLLPPPTPTPTLTPTRTNTPRFTNTPRPQTPAGTPVPGNPPGKLNDYKGPGVYMSDQPEPLFYYDCNSPYGRYGSAMHTLTLWFYPNESVSYQSQTLPGLVVQQGTLRANGEGIVEITFDPSTWPGEHYHINFRGQSSKVLYCGHFQLMTSEGSAAPQEPIMHTPEEIELWKSQEGNISE